LSFSNRNTKKLEDDKKLACLHLLQMQPKKNISKKKLKNDDKTWFLVVFHTIAKRNELNFFKKT